MSINEIDTRFSVAGDVNASQNTKNTLENLLKKNSALHVAESDYKGKKAKLALNLKKMKHHRKKILKNLRITEKKYDY